MGTRRFLAILFAATTLASDAGAPPAAPGQAVQVLDLSGYRNPWALGQLAEVHNGGLSFASLTTSGDARPSLVVTPGPFRPALDLRGRFIRVWVRVDQLEKLAGLELRLSSDGLARSWFGYTVPLFADAAFNLLQPGTWTPLSVGFGHLRAVGAPDRSAIDSVGLYVSDKGQGPVTVDWGGIEIVDEPAEGVLSITFDDGYDEQIEAARAMARHRFRGTAYVMPDQIGTFGYLRLTDLRKLRDEFGWDVAAHHAIPLTDLPPGKLEDTLLGVQLYLQEHGLGDGFAHLAYPLGKHDDARVLPLVRKHFHTARVASGGAETLPPADPHRLRTLGVFASVTPEQVGAAARRAREHREWLILMFHRLVEKPENDLDYRLADFAAALAEIERSGIAVRTVSEVWHALEGRPPVARAVAGAGAPSPALR
jgi:hypothetical protein